MEQFGWDDAEDIAIELFEKMPNVNPLTVRFTDLHDWVCELENFNDDAMKSPEGKLESIQMAWLDQFNDSAN